MEAQQQAFTAAGQPLISVDTKQKALMGDVKNAGQVWCHHPIEVKVHDFPSAALARAVPYAIYAPQRHHGAVCMGTSGDTPACAVPAMAPWWQQSGRVASPQATPLLILGDAGGRHGDRPRWWKAPRHSQLSNGLGLHVSVCHDPPGGSKWHPIEPRLCSQSSLNGAGQPSRTLATMLGYLRDTTTTTGLQVTASLLAGVYQTAKKATAAVMKTLDLAHHAVWPPWNYPIRPRVEGSLMT